MMQPAASSASQPTPEGFEIGQTQVVADGGQVEAPKRELQTIMSVPTEPRAQTVLSARAEDTLRQIPGFSSQKIQHPINSGKTLGPDHNDGRQHGAESIANDQSEPAIRESHPDPLQA